MADWQGLRSIGILEVAQQLGLKMVGRKAICFSGHDTEPSLQFYPAENRWYCFGCDMHGDSIDLVRHTLRLSSLREAADWLRQMRGGRLPSAAGRPARAAGPVQTFEADSVIYEWLLAECPLLPDGHEYLRSRGYRDQVVQDFGIGQIQNADAVEAKAIGTWSNARLVKSGLLFKRTNNQQKRLVWPSHALLFPDYVEGRVTYLQGRTMDAASDKRWIGLIGISKPLVRADALSKLPTGSELWICEGFTDLMAATQFGKNAVAILGAHSFRKEWVSTLKRFSVVVAADGDDAGDKMIESIRENFRARGLPISVKRPPRGSDLADLLRRRNEGIQQ